MSKENIILTVKTASVNEFPVTVSNLEKNLYFNLEEELISSLDGKSRKAISSPDYTAKIRFLVYNGSDLVKNVNNIDRSKIVYNAYVTLSTNGSQAVIGLTVSLRLAIMELFPFSEAWRCLRPLGLEQPKELTESFCIASVPVEGKPGGWVIYPKKQVAANTGSEALNALISCMTVYGSGTHLSAKNKTGGSGGKHLNRVEKSTEWKPAEEYTGDIMNWENCIYTLASDPDADGICDVYIGEATNKKGSQYLRLNVYDIGGRKYIDHTKDEACRHRFTRFRIDKLKDDASGFLHDAQDLAIGISYMLRKECPKGYRMTNSAKAKAFNEADVLDIKRNGKR